MLTPQPPGGTPFGKLKRYLAQLRFWVYKNTTLLQTKSLLFALLIGQPLTRPRPHDFGELRVTKNFWGYSKDTLLLTPEGRLLLSQIPSEVGNIRGYSYSA